MHKEHKTFFAEKELQSNGDEELREANRNEALIMKSLTKHHNLVRYVDHVE